jgi:hypothetical protein
MSERFDAAVTELSLAWRSGEQERIAAARVALEVAHWDDVERRAASAPPEASGLREAAERFMAQQESADAAVAETHRLWGRLTEAERDQVRAALARSKRGEEGR